MRIAQLAPLRVAVPPVQYGGTERCVANLTDALVRLGHDVTLFASGDSRTTANLVPIVPKAVGFDPKVEYNAYHVTMLAEVYRQADQFDVIHSHLEYITLPFVNQTDTPTVLTMHGRIDGDTWQRVLQTYRHANYISISGSQQKQLPDLNWLGTVHHSVDVDAFPFHPNPGTYLAFVGRVSTEKGLDRAIRIAIRAKLPLKVAVKIDPSEEAYFEETIKPMLQHPLITYLGQVDEDHKRELMGNALALLAPINWPEPFGMVFIEAMACGTPVLTSPLGSVPEIMEDGVTGILCQTEDDYVRAVGRLRTLSRSRIREIAKRRFDIRRMALEYLNLYALVQRRKTFFSMPLQGSDSKKTKTEERAISFASRLALEPTLPSVTDEVNGSVFLP